MSFGNFSNMFARSMTAYRRRASLTAKVGAEANLSRESLATKTITAPGPEQHRGQQTDRKSLLKAFLSKYKKRKQKFQLSGEDTDGEYEIKTANRSYRPATLLQRAAPGNGSCLQCTAVMPATELRERMLEVDGHEVGICPDCYPEFLQFLEDSAAENNPPATMASTGPGSVRSYRTVGLQSAESLVDSDRPASPISIRSMRVWREEADDEQAGTDDGAAPNDDTVAVRTLSRYTSIQPRLTTTTTTEALMASLSSADCSICGESHPASGFAAATPDCRHKVTYCRACLAAWIASSLESRGWDNIRCPDGACSRILGAADVHAHAAAATRDAYSAAATKATLSHIPGFAWCLNAACGSGQILESGAASGTTEQSALLVCHSCGFRTCALHGVPWHEGETCAEYAARTDAALQRRQDALSLETMERTTKRCPACRARIEKIDGCDHMSCRSCKHEFCWLCGADYERIRAEGNGRHEAECRHWREG